MTTYIFEEKQDINSTRDGQNITAKNLSSAKRKASRMQAFFGTVLAIKDECGNTLSTKINGKWEDK